MTRVSVVIPVYNVERWLPACLDSVLAQTLQDIEVLCVDDCSPDGSAEILRAYAARDPRVKLLRTPQNSGQGVARNLGLDAAIGDYVYFLDSDDLVVPQALAELSTYADELRLDGVFFDSEVLYDSPKLAKRYASYPASHTGAYPEGAVAGLDLFEAFMAQRDWTCYVQRQLWRRAFLQREGIRFPSWASHEDEAFAFEALLAAARVSYVPKPYFIRRYREGSVMTTKPTLKNFASYFQAVCRMTRFMDERGVHSLAADRNVARIYDALLRQHRQLLDDGADVAAWFRGTPLQGEYLLFAAAQKAYLHHGMLSESTLQAAKQAGSVYVYGAGVLARNVHQHLALEDVAVECFLVTSMEGNPSALLGHHVRCVDDVAPQQGALVVVAVTDGFRAEVEALLDARGWRHVYCKDGWLA